LPASVELGPKAPVILPSGRATLVTTPVAVAPPLKTIGIVVVAWRAAAVAGDSTDTITSTLSSTSSRA